MGLLFCLVMSPLQASSPVGGLGNCHLLSLLVPHEKHRRLHLLKYGKLPAQASPSVHFIEVWETPCWRDIHLSILERVGQSSIVGGCHGKLLSSSKYGKLPAQAFPSVHSNEVWETPCWRDILWPFQWFRLPCILVHDFICCDRMTSYRKLRFPACAYSCSLPPKFERLN